MIDKELTEWEVKNKAGGLIGMLSGKWFKLIDNYIYEVITDKSAYSLWIVQQTPIIKNTIKEVVYEYPRIT